MFVRFRGSPNRLQISVVETRRLDGRVRHEHIASLGSIETPLSVAGRIVFWQRVNERLGKLSNRIDPAMQGKVRGDIHARIPMVTLDEQRALQLENAEADERFWSVMQDMNQSKVADHRALVAKAQGAIATGEADAAKAADSLARAKDRAERIRKGEDGKATNGSTLGHPCLAQLPSGLRLPFTPQSGAVPIGCVGLISSDFAVATGG
jgi:hypothetical protein